jgi:YD repeat-containing protein
MKTETIKRLAALAVMLTLNMTTAPAQQRTIYGSDGRVQGRVTTDSAGNVTVYDATGRVQNRTSTDSQGTTTVYDASGRKAGSVTAPKSQQGK